jgi:DNA-binding CsgD family transcriptional regulator
MPLESVVGRESELVRIGSFLDDAAEDALALCLEGVAGIGKTTLWRAGLELGRGRGYRVLSCQPTAAETAFSFTALGDLLSPAIAEALPELPAPQRRAVEAALALASTEGPAVDERLIGLGLLSTLRLLACRQPVLVAVDDVQWLDPPSAAVLQFAARRLTDEPVKLLVSVRLEPGAPRLQLEGALSDRLFRIGVGPLGVGDLHRLVVARLSKPLSRPTLRRVYDTSGGNPFYALEIARLLLEGETTLRPGEPLPIPRTLEELVRARLERLPRTVRHVLETAALLSEPTLTALTGASPEPEQVGARLDRAAGAGVIELDGDWVRFTHPLLAAAVVSGVGPQRRRQLHARLAELVSDPEERAQHLALGSDVPDAAVAAALDKGARHAALRGAPAVAAGLAELADQRTPPDAREAYWQRLIEAGLCYATAGDLPRARGLLEPLTDEIPPGVLHADVLLDLAELRWDNNGVASSLAERALAEVGDDDARRALILVHLGILAFSSGAGPSLRHFRAALEAADRSGDDELITHALLKLVTEEVWAGDMTPGLLERALARASAAEDHPHTRTPLLGVSSTTWLGLALMALGRYEEARALLERARADELVQGVQLSSSETSFCLTQLECRLGEWRKAAQHASECWELYEQLGLEPMRPLLAKALVGTHLGNFDEARAAAERGIALSTEIGSEYHVLEAHRVFGFLELSLGNAAAAVAYLQPAVRRVRELGWREPGTWDLLPNAAEALIAVGDLDGATELVDELEDWGRTMNSRWARANGGRCRGLLRSAQGDLDGALAAFEYALREHHRLPTPLDRARTLLALGALQRRMKQKRAARESLEEALAVFEELGARLWADKARSELRRVGGRAPAGDILTATERQVAALVAEGRPNKEIAAMLFVTVKAVEANLTRIYAKLGIRSRTELARLVGRERPVEEDRSAMGRVFPPESPGR